ncbi:aminoglycoside phosphotransferase [Pigmentiphaga sp. NML080357]|uniref:aminoglycoside phosphotransferase family protein n=1 Tax=Pigmentiphaga sp. NML080357 TaxID=2008675 RepID=UPI000B4212BB|nr:phosphotransferase [Pigmentiphaga sp. NML080357]OVZ57586.1 aminoglycoside phosphotransferase [Pigmentiphaga sp. NML080357]
MNATTDLAAGQSGADPRLTRLAAWISGLPPELELDPASLQPASSDASFRRYFRLGMGAGTAVVMDAPPDKEDCRPFLHVAGLLRDAGVHVPQVLAQDPAQGFLLLSDLGRTTYVDYLRGQPTPHDTHRIYMDALASLVKLQQSATTGLVHYDKGRLATELELFPDWYAARYRDLPLDASDRDALNAVFDTLIDANLAQPFVLVHRDFHSPNLMVTDLPADGPNYGPNPGVIDFQDAVVGPITYDLASVLTDARTTWDEAQQLDWGIRYWEMARKAGLPVPGDFAEFHRAYEWMGLQRNLRILGVFARLAHRDGKRHYLDHMPRVNTYVRQVAGRYLAFKPLMKLLDKLDGRQAATGYTF